MRKRRKQNSYSDAPYFHKYVKHRALKNRRIYFRGIDKYAQKVAIVYMIQKYRGKGCKDTDMDMFCAGKLYDINDNENIKFNDNMLLTMKCNEVYVSKVDN